MIWSGKLSKKELDAGTRFRATHSNFLTRAIRFGIRFPRIPAKPVDQGGYSGLLKLPEHEKRSTLWWGAAMSRMDRMDQADRSDQRGK